MRYNILY